MKNLMYKEFKLAINPFFYVVLLLGGLLLIPEYPYYIALMYVCFIVIPNLFLIGKDQRDIEFSVLLPVRKRDIVRARVYSIVLIELMQIGVAAVFAIIKYSLAMPGSSWSLDTNIVFFGFAFMMYGIFNLVFFPMFYKTTNKIAAPTIVALIIGMAFVAGMEFLVQAVPALRVLDGFSPQTLIYQIPVLAIGALLFAALNVAAYRMSAKRFEMIDV